MDKAIIRKVPILDSKVKTRSEVSASNEDKDSAFPLPTQQK